MVQSFRPVSSAERRERHANGLWWPGRGWVKLHASLWGELAEAAVAHELGHVVAKPDDLPPYPWPWRDEWTANKYAFTWLGRRALGVLLRGGNAHPPPGTTLVVEYDEEEDTIDSEACLVAVRRDTVRVTYRLQTWPWSVQEVRRERWLEDERMKSAGAAAGSGRSVRVTDVRTEKAPL
jgi:hypothetical protein